MSVAKCLGVDDLDAPNMRELRAEWPRWRRAVPALSAVDDLRDLPQWTQNAEPHQRDAVLTALRYVAGTDRRAFALLAWLLMPGASRIAGRLCRLADQIDEIVAGQLWIQICEHEVGDDKYVAKKILDRVAKESMAEFGIGDFARRRDPAWAAAVLIDVLDDSLPDEVADDVVEPEEELADLLRRAIDSGKLSDADRDLLLDLAHAAEQIGAPLRRGRAGLTTPSVTQMVEESHAMAGRTIRRHAADALDALGEVARHGGLAM